ncbi:hypothetical protein [Planosporangium thailandense]|uniref:hypothetical protein n=1 Tax=Planosporangium thailandense TaxID=765197 RepID=UPI003B833A47
MGTERRRRRMRRSSPAAETTAGPAAGPETGAATERGADTATEQGGGAATERGADAAPAQADTVTGQEAVAPRSPTPHDLAERGGTFAMTTAVADPDDEPDGPDGPEPVAGPEWTGDDPVGHGRSGDDPYGERGLRGLVGGGSSQVTVGAAMRARDAARPSDADLAAAEAELVIVRRGWVPREDLPPRGPRR